MSDRIPLTGTILLHEKDEAGRFTSPRTFRILKPLSHTGSTSVCYEAEHNNTIGSGVLKEFFPTANYCPCHYLHRDAGGHITVLPDDAYLRPDYAAEKEKYLEPYLKLRSYIRAKNNKALADFIPPFEIYYDLAGTDGNEGSVYVWTPDRTLTTFAEICTQIRREPKTDPEKKLVTVLRCVQTLAKCVLLLHDAGFLHRDLNPFNFGFSHRGSPESISLFDINTLCSQYDLPEDQYVGTRGFSEPHAPPDMMTDVYSIGATLFYALIDTEETRKNQYLYDPEMYGDLKSLVDRAALINACEANAHPKLRYMLTKILRGCLAPRSAGTRYTCCETLLRDMEEALFYALPPEVARRSRAGEEWRLVDVQAAAQSRLADDTLAMRFHLYEHPLYRALASGSDTLRVLLLGLGKYGQSFLDCCLQMGLIADIRLKVTAASGEDADTRSYLADRPELPRFFNVNGSLGGDPEAYGDLRFLTAQLYGATDAECRKSLRGLLRTVYGAGNPDYIFIALGSDEMNLRLAKACKALCKNAERPPEIHYVLVSSPAPAEAPGYALTPDADPKKTAGYAEAARIAFNTNLLWFRKRNMRFSDIRRGFREPYNFTSSMAFALSVNYKLFGAGVDPDAVSPAEAARQFAGCVQNRETLICLEHKRWVTERICEGWRPLEDPAGCPPGDTKNKRAKRHLCLFRSRPAMTLAGWNDEAWDTAPDVLLSTLDPLDRASVLLHRHYMDAAEALEAAPGLLDGALESLQSTVNASPAAADAFGRWFSVISRLRRGEKKAFGDYPLYRAALKEAVADFPAERKRIALGQIKAFDELFTPVYMRMEYRDLKQGDADLVDSLPFILTYDPNARVAVPFEDAAAGRTAAFLRNAAALSALDPEKLLYIYALPAEGKPCAFTDAAKDAAAYAAKKNLRVRMDFLLLADDPARAEAAAEALKTLSGNIGKITVLPTKEAGKLRAALRAFGKGPGFFALEDTPAPAAALLRQTGLYETLPVFRALPNGTLLPVRECETLRWAGQANRILPSDLPAGALPLLRFSPAPSFYAGSRALWNYRAAHRDAADALSKALADDARANDPAPLRFACGGDRSAFYRCLLPAAVFTAVHRLLASLTEAGAIAKESRVRLADAGACEVTLFGAPEDETNRNRLFADPYLLFDASVRRETARGKACAVVERRTLSVKDLRLKGKTAAAQREALAFLQSAGNLRGLTQTETGVSFSYASQEIKALLTAPTRLTMHGVYRSLDHARLPGSGPNGDPDLACGTVNGFDCILLTLGLRAAPVVFAPKNREAQALRALTLLCDEIGGNVRGILLTEGEPVPAAENCAVIGAGGSATPSSISERILLAASEEK